MYRQRVAQEVKGNRLHGQEAHLTLSSEIAIEQRHNKVSVICVFTLILYPTKALVYSYWEK